MSKEKEKVSATLAGEHALVSLLGLVPAGDTLGDASIADIVLVSYKVGVEASGHSIALLHRTTIDGGNGARVVASKEGDIASVGAVVRIVEFVMDTGTASGSGRRVEVVVLRLRERRTRHSRLARERSGGVVPFGNRTPGRCIGLVRVV